MAKYHKYIFDEKNRTFVGEFENMYREEVEDGYDAWHQEDMRQLNRKILLTLLGSQNFDYIVDLGCGKGVITSHLKKDNNTVVGLDISSTALKIAKQRFPDIIYSQCDINNLKHLQASLQYPYNKNENHPFDLVVIAECLSYLSNWREILEVLASHSKVLALTLYLPPNPIGFVKSHEELNMELERYYCIRESIWLAKSRFSIILADSLCSFPKS